VVGRNEIGAPHERGIAEFAATPNGGLTFLPHPGSK
jgi:hypothetical protein